MDIEELKSSWNKLSERVSNLEEQNRNLAEQALKVRLSSRVLKFRIMISVKLFALSIALLLFTSLIDDKPSVYGDWGIRILGTMVLANIFLYVYNYRHLVKMNPIKNSITTVLESSCRFEVAFNYYRIINICLAVVALILIGIWFHDEDVLFYSFLMGLALGLTIAIISFRKINSQLKLLKSELHDLEILAAS